MISSWEAAVLSSRPLTMACPPSKWLVFLPATRKTQSCGYCSSLTCSEQPEALNKALIALPCWNAGGREGAPGPGGRDL